jgi:hypothetical protein
MGKLNVVIFQLLEGIKYMQNESEWRKKIFFQYSEYAERPKADIFKDVFKGLKC